MTKAGADGVAASVRSMYAQTDGDHARRQLGVIADCLRPNHPDGSDMLEEAEDDLPAYSVSPRAHWKKLWSNNLLERLLREVKRQTQVVGIFPDREAAARLVVMVLFEQDEEWQAGLRYISEDSMQEPADQTQ